MAQYGRRMNPGEKGVQGALDQRAVMNRTLRAQVTAVNAENGYVLLTYESMPSGGKFATVPPLWMSFPEAQVGGPSWGRYMPQQSDLVKVSFDFDDRPHVMGYDIVAGKDNVADGESGWPQIHDQYTAGKESEDAKKAKFAQFTPLNPGEFDFMSSGGAYIYGNNKGRLYFAGGSVSISLVKNDLRISQRGQLWSHLADDCDLRFGQVRRIDTSDQQEKKVGDGKQKEFSVILKKTESAGQSTALASLVLGNVLDKDGTEEKTPKADKPMRFSYKAMTSAGEVALHMAIDDTGNWEMLAPNADKGIVFDFTNSEWKSTSKTVNWEATESFKVKSPKTEFTADTSFIVYSPKVFLGGASSSDQTFKLTNDGLEIGVSPSDYMALASLVKQEISSLKDSVSSFVSTFNSHTHIVNTQGPPLKHTGTAQSPTSTATSPSAVKDVKSSFVKSL